MKTVKQVSQVSGVSVRTLHHYDAIGLLKPTRVTEAGYRLYDDTALERLQSILLFRELQFPLKEIGRILDTPGFDRQAALNDQIHLLELQREHIDRLLTDAREMQKNGGKIMSFSVFDKKQQEAFAAEAKQRWGSTDAYRESQTKTAGKSEEPLQFRHHGLGQMYVADERFKAYYDRKVEGCAQFLQSAVDKWA